TTFGAFLKAILSSWFTGMSGPLSVPLAVAAVFVPNETIRILLALTAIVCFWAAAYTVWRHERRARNEAETAARPSETLRFAVQKLLRYPDAVQETAVAPLSIVERFVADQQPRRLFELLMRYEETDIASVPQIGEKLWEHFALYHEFRQAARQFDDDLLTKIIDGRDWYLQAWQ